MLLNWATEKGVLGLSNLDLHAQFSDDVLATDKDFKYDGVAARVDIPHRQAFLAIPLSLVLSYKTFLEEEPELFEYVLHTAPEIFDENMQTDAEFLLLCFYLMLEWTKGKASKLYPYLASLPREQKFFCDWDRQVLEATQDEQLQKLSREYKRNIDF